MKDKIEENVDYVCVTPIKITKKGEPKVGESTIIRSEKNLIVVKENKNKR